MKMTAFKVFALSVAIVCLASSPVSRASPVLKSDSATSENPIVMKKYPGGRLVKNLVGQNVVDFKTYDSMSITNEVVQKPAVYEPMVSQTLHKQRRSYYLEVELLLKKEQEGDSSSSSVDSKQVVLKSPEPSNEVEDSHQLNENQNSEQSNENQKSEQSNEVQNSEQSNEVQNSEQSNEVQNSEQSNEVQNSEQSNEVQNSEQSDSVQVSQEFNENQYLKQSSDDSEPLPRIIPNSESEYFEDFSDSEENRDNDDKKEIGLIGPNLI
ncbi:hypothetical protein QTP88_005345 [Uroleucon formosanum]